MRVTEQPTALRPGEGDECPYCHQKQQDAARRRERSREYRESRNDVFDAHEACRRMAGPRAAFDILLDYADAAYHSRLICDLWDAAAPGVVGASGSTATGKEVRACQ